MLSKSLVQGFAIFSMFFGAGNIVFPLLVGQHVQGGLPFALIGLTLTAILIPFLGLLGITFFEGNYEAFFRKWGKWPGFLMMVGVIALIGPFGGIPRCVTLTFSTLKVYLPSLHLLWFSAAAIILVLLGAIRKTKVVAVLGKCLTPLLLVFLSFLVIKGLFFTSFEPLKPSLAYFANFLYGLKEGYNTMDLLAAFFFSSIICKEIQATQGKEGFLKNFLKASLIGGLLLILTYFSFSYLAAFHSKGLNSQQPDMWLGKLGLAILGQKGGIVISMIVALSCLTTAIALAATAATFLQEKIFKNRVSYKFCLLSIGLLSFSMSTLGFTGIVSALAYILQICYPVLLLLTLYNIYIKLRPSQLSSIDNN